MPTRLINEKDLETAKEYIQLFGPGVKDFLLTEANLNLHSKVIEDLANQAEEQYNEMVKVYEAEEEIIDEDGIKAVFVTFENNRPVKKIVKIKNNLERLKKFLKADEVKVMDLGFEIGDSPYVAVVDKSIQNLKGCHWFSIEHILLVGNILIFKKGLKEVEEMDKIKIEYEGLSENLDEIFSD